MAKRTKSDDRYYIRQTDKRCFTVFYRYPSIYGPLRGSRRYASYVTRKRAEYCVWRLHTGRQRAYYS